MRKLIQEQIIELYLLEKDIGDLDVWRHSNKVIKVMPRYFNNKYESYKYNCMPSAVWLKKNIYLPLCYKGKYKVDLEQNSPWR